VGKRGRDCRGIYLIWHQGTINPGNGRRVEWKGGLRERVGSPFLCKGKKGAMEGRGSLGFDSEGNKRGKEMKKGTVQSQVLRVEVGGHMKGEDCAIVRGGQGLWKKNQIIFYKKEDENHQKKEKRYE